MRIVFSQNWAEEKHGKRVREILWRIVKLARATNKCDRLLVKVFFYTKLKHGSNGSYRNIWEHGFYEKEWDKYVKSYIKPINSIITLKLSQDATDNEIAELFAHELGHHLSYIKTSRFGEKTASKFAEKITQQWRTR